MSSTYEQLGQQIGALTDEKNTAYGSSFAKAGEFLRLLYPDGIQPEQLGDALLLVRIFDKQMRIATDKDALGESPYRDIAGYGLLGAKQDEERKNKGCGSVSGVGAGEESQEPSDSAARSASEPTTPNAVETSEQTKKQPSPKPSSDTSASTAASAQSVMASASGNEGVLLSASCDAIVTCLRAVSPQCLTGIELRTDLRFQYAAPFARCLNKLLALRFIQYSATRGYNLTQEGIYYWNRREDVR